VFCIGVCELCFLFTFSNIITALLFLSIAAFVVVLLSDRVVFSKMFAPFFVVFFCC